MEEAKRKIRREREREKERKREVMIKKDNGAGWRKKS